MGITSQQFAVMEARVASNRKKSMHYEQANIDIRPMEAGKPKPALSASLEHHKAKQPRSKQSMVIIVTMVMVGHRLFDDDNLAGACKPLRDAIAETLGLDDGDKRIRWQYGQTETKGEQGVIVKIERI